MNLNKFRRLKQAVESKRRDHDRAIGAVESLLKTLKREHGCSSLKEAEALYEKLQKQEAKAELEFEDKFAAFENKWKRRLYGSEPAKPPRI